MLCSRPLKPVLRELRLSLELTETPRAGHPRTVRLSPVEPIALAGVSRLGLELGQAVARLSARIRCHGEVARRSARGVPRESEGSRMKTSVATSVSRSWLLTNEATRWRVSRTTAAIASRL